MSKRNFILLIIVLVIVTIVIFVFLSFNTKKPTPQDPGTGTNFFSQFNPFGTKPTQPPSKPPVDVSGYEPPTTPAESKLMKVSTMPIAGYTVFIKERLRDVPVTPRPVEETTPAPTKKGSKVTPTPPLTELVPALRYTAKENGNIYQTFVDKIQERKFSGTTLPKVHDAYFGNKGNSVLMRHLKSNNTTIETFVGNLPKELLGGDTTTTNEINGSFLPDNVIDISISPDTSKAFYLFESGEGVVGITMTFLDGKKVQIFDSPFTEWISSWPKMDTITLTTRPAGSVEGYVYNISSSGKNLGMTLGNIKGLTTLTSPDSKLILTGDNNLTLGLYDTTTRNSKVFAVKTLPEKCVWGKVSDTIYCAVPKSNSGNSYPDNWYRGEVSFSDEIWKIDVKTSNASMILDPVTVIGGEQVDGIKLSLDENEDHLFFVNKKDSFLWKFDLK